MLRHAIKILALAAVVAALMLAVRFLLVEPDEMAERCASHAGQVPCWIRGMAIQGFVHKWYGWVSVIAAMLAYLSGFRVLAVLAMLAGVAGVVLYDFELAAIGLMLGALFLMRRRSIFQLLGKHTAARQQASTE
jgi:hypothetical protein